MTEFLFAPANAPFAAVIMLMLALAAAEAAGLLFGVAPSSTLDQAFPDFGADAPEIGAEGGETNGAAELLSWLGVGRVPLLIVLIMFLTCFGLLGYGLQAAARAALGAPLPLFAAIPGAFFAAAPLTGALARLFQRVMPRQETEVVSADSFIGRVATVLRGSARRGLPAEARVKDAYGRTHYVRVEPESASEAFEQGTEALLIARDGSVYRAVRNPSAALSPKA
jgi:membrane protein implicated in regulation of membrane protease activity